MNLQIKQIEQLQWNLNRANNMQNNQKGLQRVHQLFENASLEIQLSLKPFLFSAPTFLFSAFNSNGWG